MENFENNGNPSENVEEKTPVPVEAQKNSKKIWIRAALIALAIIVATALFLWIRGAIAQRELEKLAAQVTEPVTEASVETTPVETEPPTEAPVETEPTVKTMLPKYADLYQQVNDLFGWIRIDDTVLDYPVMRANDGDNEKYLHADIHGEYSFVGIPFADVKCTHESDNILLYGHNIVDGSMFAGLFNYEDKEYWEEHPTIMFSDLYEDYEYEILAVFRDRIYRKSDTCFKFYQFIDAENEEDFDYAISQFKEKSLYDTGVDAEYGDKLITLITCAYHVDNGRLVVVARRK